MCSRTKDKRAYQDGMGQGWMSGRSSARWNGVNIAVMVFGFILFWPLGLFILAWIISGRDVRELPGAVRHLWQRYFGGVEPRLMSATDNVVFNEYQQTQYDRIREIKTEIHERARRFKAFKSDVQRRADEEEFHRFMASAPESGESNDRESER